LVQVVIANRNNCLPAADIGAQRLKIDFNQKQLNKKI